MTDEQRPLQALFNPDDYEGDVTEGIGFEPGVRYTLTIDKPPTGKYMQYGPNQPPEKANLAGLYVLARKCPEDLKRQYIAHPDQFEIFTPGEIDGQQALIPGKDFEKFKPFLTPTITVGWVHTTESGAKRMVWMQLNARGESANPNHPEWESYNVRLARRMGVKVPEPGSKEKFSLSFLHVGVAITAEVEMVKRKGDTRERAQIVLESVEPANAEETGAKQQTITESTDIDPEIHATVLELAEGCTKVTEVIKKVKAYLKEEKIEEPDALAKYSTAITRMKDRKEILK